MTAEKPMNEFPVMDTGDGIVLFHPNIPAKAAFYVSEVLNTRWIGQGPKVPRPDHARRCAGPSALWLGAEHGLDRKSTRLNSSHLDLSRMPSSA